MKAKKMASTIMTAEMEAMRMSTDRRGWFEASPLQSRTFMPNKDVKKESGS